MALLDLVQSACSEINIPVPTQLFGSTDEQVIQLLALANREGKEFSQRANRAGGWQELHKEYTFLTVCIPATTGNTTLNSPIITNIPSTAGIVAGTWAVFGNGIPFAAYVVSVDSGTQVTLNLPATITGTGVALTFGQNAYAMPADFNYFITQTFWDGNFRWQLLGPLEAQEKNVLKYGISPVGPRRRFWIRNNLMYINPTPTDNGTVIAYDYFSNGWCASAGGTAQTKFGADTDNYVLDNDCLVLGMKWRYLHAKGLEYGEDKQIYENACERVMARNGGERDLPLNARSTEINLLSNANVPDTGFGA